MDENITQLISNLEKRIKFLEEDHVSNLHTHNGSDSSPVEFLLARFGEIGGFLIGDDYIKNKADTMGLASTVTSADDVRFWAGGSFTNRATAAFRVTEAGAVTGSNFAITGGTIGAGVAVAIGAINIASRGWVQSCAFTVTDADTVAWGAGTFTSADGTAYSISGGNTGNMAAKTYIYLDVAVSTTAYQSTATVANATGAGKVLIAVAQNGTGEAKFMVMNDNSYNIDAANIVANSITANELSTSITYAGSIIIDTAGLIRSGQTTFRSGTGWFIGNVSGTPKLSIGVGSTGPEMYWDGTDLIATNIKIVQNFTARQDLTAGVPVGISNVIGGVAKANDQVNSTSEIGTTDFVLYDIQWLTGDKFVCLFTANLGTGNSQVAIVTVDRATMAVSFGTSESVGTLESSGAGGSASVVVYGTDRFVIFSIINGSNNLNYSSYSVSGTTITGQQSGTLISSGSLETCVACLVDTNEIVGVTAGSADSAFFYVTMSTYTATLTDSDSASSPWSGGGGVFADVCKIATDKAIFVSSISNGGSHKMKVVTVNGTSQTLGSDVAVSGTLSGSKIDTRVVSPATDRAVLITGNTTGTVNYSIAVISGTVPAVGAVISNVARDYTNMIYDSANSLVLEFSNDAQYKIVWTDSTLSRVQTGANMNINVDGNFTKGAYSTDNSYYLEMGNFSQSTASPSYNIQGMSDNFLGIVQTTTARGGTVPVLIKGVDSNQVSLSAGTYYLVSNGTLTAIASSETINTLDDTFVIQAISSTQILL